MSGVPRFHVEIAADQLRPRAARRLLLLAAVLAGCSPSLPEPESAGAQILQRRCAGCHRLSAPSSMTMPMWEFQVDKMRGIYAQRGFPWLSPEEEATLMDYLRRHAEGR